ncbi:MAG: FlgO family outer membrane protein [Methylomonas sp.]|nr:FlgO family outer membrane protein [Methylomonas sp.]
MNKHHLLATVLLTTILLGGCGPRFYQDTVEDDNLVEVSYNAVDQMLTTLKQPLPRGSLVVINSLVNVDNLGQTLPFGRIVSDQITSALHQSGYRVMGMELPTEIFAKNDVGILELPEKTKEALNAVHANALVIGTYATGRKNVYVSLRIVDIATQNIVTSTDYSIPMGPDAKRMATIPESKD